MEEQNITEQPIDTNDNSITLGDVVLMYNIIATVSRRGGFEADEFQIVGKLFEKLKTYIPAKEENSETASTAETTNTSTEVCDADQMKFDFAQQDETVTQ